MQTLAVESLDTEDFLSTPALFRFGPLALVAAALAFSSLVLGTALWRIDDGRLGEYVKSFAAAEAAAVSARTNLTQALARVAQNAKAVDQLQKLHPESTLALASVDDAGLHDLVADVVAFDAQGKLLRSGAIPSPGEPLAQHLVDGPLARRTQPGTPLVMPLVTLGAQDSVLPVAYRMSSPGEVHTLVYLVHLEPLVAAARKLFDPYGGWLRVLDSQGEAVLEFHESQGTLSLGPPTTRIWDTPVQAMQHPLDYASMDLLAAEAPRSADSALRVRVGIAEAAALYGYERRVTSTWVITIGLVGMMSLLVALTVLSIRRFSKKERYLRRLATVDALTGLPNRRSFKALLEREAAASRRRGPPLSLLMLDLDNFKSVNDSVGHVVGDALLQHVGRVLVDVAPVGTHVCRLAGDEFTVIAPGAGAGEARMLAERILDRLKEPVQLPGTLLRPRASIGVASMPIHTSSEVDLMRFADTAMYRAKAEGKARCVVFDANMAQHDADAAQLMLELEKALSDSGGLYLDYQPKFSCADGSVSGFEALMRWKHPTQGSVSPAHFIPLAEDSGLIIEVGTWVMREAVEQMRRWHDATGEWQKVAVNVSTLQLRDESFVHMVRALLELHRVPSNQLQVELTETALAHDAEDVRRILCELRNLGVTVALDDFGTGYSSLAALQTFQIDCLKLDRSFVSKVLTVEGEKVCRAMCALGSALGVRVVAEGVETREQALALRSMGCHEAQGFLLSRPLAAKWALDIHSTSPSTAAWWGVPLPGAAAEATA